MVKEEFTEKCIILKVGQFRESDCWVRFLSPSRGIMSAFAFGGLKSKRRFPGCLEALNYVSLYVTSNRTGSYYALQEGSLLRRFSGIHKDLVRWGMAVNCLKFVVAAHIGAFSSSEVFEHFYLALSLLETQSHPSDKIPLMFRVWVACEYGYRPDCLQCIQCGRRIGLQEKGVFSIDSGCVTCLCCHQSNRIIKGRLLPGEVLHVMQSIVNQSRLEDNNGQEISPDSIRIAWQVLDTFVQIHMGLIWDSGDFRRL